MWRPHTIKWLKHIFIQSFPCIRLNYFYAFHATTHFISSLHSFCLSFSYSRSCFPSHICPFIPFALQIHWEWCCSTDAHLLWNVLPQNRLKFRHSPKKTKNVIQKGMPLMCSLWTMCSLFHSFRTSLALPFTLSPSYLLEKVMILWPRHIFISHNFFWCRGFSFFFSSRQPYYSPLVTFKFLMASQQQSEQNGKLHFIILLANHFYYGTSRALSSLYAIFYFISWKTEKKRKKEKKSFEIFIIFCLELKLYVHMCKCYWTKYLLLTRQTQLRERRSTLTFLTIKRLEIVFANIIYKIGNIILMVKQFSKSIVKDSFLKYYK